MGAQGKKVYLMIFKTLEESFKKSILKSLTSLQLVLSSYKNNWIILKVTLKKYEIEPTKTWKNKILNPERFRRNVIYCFYLLI